MKLSPFLFHLSTFHKKSLFLRQVLKSEFLLPKTFQVLLHDQVGEVWRQTRAFQSKNIMPSNVEVKARVKDFEALKKKAKGLSDSEGEVIEQKDVFFNVPQGRLKLRFLQSRPSQLIFYERDDKSGPKMSDYHIATTDKPDDLANVLSRSLGTKGIVKKKRLLYLVGQTRVHCDEVDGLGHFMELEVVMKENQSATEGEEIAKDLMSKLGVEEADLIKGAYIDLLSSQKQ